MPGVGLAQARPNYLLHHVASGPTALGGTLTRGTAIWGVITVKIGWWKLGGSFAVWGVLFTIRGFAQNHGGSAHFKISGVVQTVRVCSKSWGS